MKTVQITESKGELSKKEQYLMTVAPNIKKLTTCKNQIVEVELFCFYIVTEGETNREILSIMTPEGEVFATNSATFIETFRQIVENFGSTGFSKVLVDVGTSKAGRDFIVAVYAD